MDGRALLLAKQYFEQAHELDPGHKDVPYVTARLKLLQTATLPAEEVEKARREAVPTALALLEDAARAGFDDWQRLESDPTLTPPRKEPRFEQLRDGLLPVDELGRRAVTLGKRPRMKRSACLRSPWRKTRNTSSPGRSAATLMPAGVNSRRRSRTSARRSRSNQTQMLIIN
jgi:hypothetical protein